MGICVHLCVWVYLLVRTRGFIHRKILTFSALDWEKFCVNKQFTKKVFSKYFIIRTCKMELLWVRTCMRAYAHVRVYVSMCVYVCVRLSETNIMELGKELWSDKVYLYESMNKCLYLRLLISGCRVHKNISLFVMMRLCAIVFKWLVCARAHTRACVCVYARVSEYVFWAAS